MYWYGHVVACGSSLLQHGLNFSTVWCTATDQCRKRLEACINAEGGHFEHLLWHCLPDIPVATHHNRFFSEPLMTTHNWLFWEPPTFERMQQTFSQMKKFCNSQVSVVTFLVVFFGFLKVKWLHLTGEVDKSVRFSCQIFPGFNVQKSLKSVNFWQGYWKK